MLSKQSIRKEHTIYLGGVKMEKEEIFPNTLLHLVPNAIFFSLTLATHQILVGQPFTDLFQRRIPDW